MIIKDLKSEIINCENREINQNKSSNLIVTSFGKNGGLYEVNTQNKTFHKLLNGDFKGITRGLHGYALVGHDFINFLDNEYKIYKRIEYHNETMDMHGIYYDNGFYYIIDVSSNTVNIVSENSLKIEDELCISGKNFDMHHMNDICVDGENILISMFSTTNKSDWKTNKDGAIVAFNKNTLEFSKIVASELNWPHNIKVIDNEIYFCESRECNFSNSSKEIAKFNGFTRGLDFDNKFFYIGQSVWDFRRFLPPKKINNISLDGGIHVYDPISKTSRFIEMPVNNIYSVLVL